MTKKSALYNVYLTIRPRLKDSRKAYESLERILDSYPAADTTLAGIGHDAHRVFFCVRFAVPLSNSAPSAIASVRCLNAIFESLFDYIPCYSVEPTAAEAATAATFLESLNKEKRITLPDLQLV